VNHVTLLVGGELDVEGVGIGWVGVGVGFGFGFGFGAGGFGVGFGEAGKVGVADAWLFGCGFFEGLGFGEAAGVVFEVVEEPAA
jgi:hypothetical protein